MKRTTTALLIIFALTGCRLLEQQRHVAATKLAAAVVRTLSDLQSSAPAVSPRTPARPVAPLAIPATQAAAAVVHVASPLLATESIAAAVPPLPAAVPPLPATNAYFNVCLKPSAKMLTPAQLDRLRVRIDRALVLCRSRANTKIHNPSLLDVERIIIHLDENGNSSL